VNFSRFQSATHISRVNCAEMDGDRSRLPANRDYHNALARLMSISSDFLFNS